MYDLLRAQLLIIIIHLLGANSVSCAKFSVCITNKSWWSGVRSTGPVIISARRLIVRRCSGGRGFRLSRRDTCAHRSDSASVDEHNLRPDPYFLIFGSSSSEWYCYYMLLYNIIIIDFIGRCEKTPFTKSFARTFVIPAASTNKYVNTYIFFVVRDFRV